MRNLRILGLALVAVLAMSIVAASAAQANEFTVTGTDSVVVTGEYEGLETENFFEVGGLKLTCKAPLFEGTKVVPSTKTPTITIIPTYEKGGECKTSLGTKATIDMNGCDYKFTVGNQIEVDKWNGSTHIECPAGQEIKYTLGPCTIDIKPQTVTGLKYTDITNPSDPSKEDITVDTNSALKATVTNVFLCPIATGEQNAKFVGNITFKGFVDVGSVAEFKEGAQVGITVD